jgi:hypothetical protein
LVTAEEPSLCSSADNSIEVGPEAAKEDDAEEDDANEDATEEGFAEWIKVTESMQMVLP